MNIHNIVVSTRLNLLVFESPRAFSRGKVTNIPGFVSDRLWGDPLKGGAWTLTVWENKAGMQNYRNSGAHRQVMPLLQKWCDEATVVHWEQEDTTLPNAVEPHRRMVMDGHFTRRSSPSPAHLERKISQPQSSKLQGLPLRPRKKTLSRVVEA